MRGYIIHLIFNCSDIKIFFSLGLIFTKSKKSTAKEEKEIATQSNLKDYSYLKREFLTTTLVINLQQANQKKRKIKYAGENQVEVRTGFRLWVTALTRQAAGSGCCTFITAAPTWPPVAASEEADNPHTFQLHLWAAKCAHIISQRKKLYQKHQCEKGKIFNSWWVTCVI